MTALELHVRVTGAGLPVVLLHAFPLSSAMWLDQRNELADVYRVITPDLRGFGGSHLGGDEPSLEHMADDVAALLDGMGLDRVVLVGHSMGGYVAMAFARRYGDRLRGVLLSDTKASPDTDAACANRLRIADVLDQQGTNAVLVEELLPALTGATTRSQRPLVQGRVRALVEASPAPAAAWCQRAMAARRDSFDALRELAVPALVLVGDEDEISPIADAQAMADAIPDARLAVLAGSGHLSAVEQPDEFTKALREFVTSLA